MSSASDLFKKSSRNPSSIAWRSTESAGVGAGFPHTPPDLQSAKLPYLPDAHVRVADNVRLRTGKALLLNIARRLHTLANRLAGLPHSITAQLFIIRAWDFDMDIDAVEQGTGDASLVFSNGSRRTPASFLRVTEVPAGRGAHNWTCFRAQWRIQGWF